MLTEQAHEKFPQEQVDFLVGRARELVKDLFRRDPLIYWLDFLFSALLGWGAFGLALRAPVFSSQQILFVGISCLALYRAVLFIHEIVHFKKGTFKVFRWVWNILCGFPFMIPIFLYQSVHFDHHKQNFYGTVKDGEWYVINGWNKDGELLLAIESRYDFKQFIGGKDVVEAKFRLWVKYGVIFSLKGIVMLSPISPSSFSISLVSSSKFSSLISLYPYFI